MLISPATEFKAELLGMIQDREFSERTGVHCSDLIYCLNKQALRRRMPLPPDEHEILLFSLGWSTQRWLTGKDEDEPTITKDGIQVTRDAVHPLYGCPWELKATFKSKDRGVEDEDSWLRQIMAQCKVTMQTRAFLTRLEICGNWKSIFGKKEEKDLPENQKPTLSAFMLEFEVDEIEDNWLWLRGRADLFLPMLNPSEIKLLPKNKALPPNHEWECKYCPSSYREVCNG